MGIWARLSCGRGVLMCRSTQPTDYRSSKTPDESGNYSTLTQFSTCGISIALAIHSFDPRWSAGIWTFRILSTCRSAGSRKFTPTRVGCYLWKELFRRGIMGRYRGGVHYFSICPPTARALAPTPSTDTNPSESV